MHSGGLSAVLDSFSIDGDDGDSDIDDVPEALLSNVNTAHQSGLGNTAQRIDLLVLFFQSPRYRIISFLFGPMACFFFVG